MKVVTVTEEAYQINLSKEEYKNLCNAVMLARYAKDDGYITSSNMDFNRLNLALESVNLID
jgi:hypothetical protein